MKVAFPPPCPQPGFRRQLPYSMQQHLFIHSVITSLNHVPLLITLGADVVGINCHFDPETCLRGMQLMVDACKEAGLDVHYIVQPLAFKTPDTNAQGFIDLPEFPFGKFQTSNLRLLSTHWCLF